MEPIKKTCNLCQSSVIEPDDHVKFTCHHSFCFCCFSYIIYQRMSTEGFQSTFFDEIEKEFECPICQNIQKITINIVEMINTFQKHFNNLFPLDKSESQICEACQEKPATLCCIGCQNQNYCEGCLNFYHQNKKFTNHKVIPLEEKHSLLENQNMACTCPSKRIMEFYCQRCKKPMCGNCLKNKKSWSTSINFIVRYFRENKTNRSKRGKGFSKRMP